MEAPHARPIVLFVAVPPALGGSNRSLLTLLAAIGPRVTRVVAAPEQGPLAAAVREQGLAEEYLGFPRPGRWGRAGRVAISLRIAAWTLRRKRELTAIHANATTGLYLAAPAAILSRVPLVVWVHDPVSTAWGKLLGPLLRPMLRHARWAAVSPLARRVVVHNRLCAPRKVEIVPNPIDPAEVRAHQARPPDSGILRVGFLTGTTRRKGFDLLPAVVERLVDLPLEWKLFVNRRPSRESRDAWERLDHVPGGRISVLGRVADVRQAYEQCDLVFIPSRHESFSRVAAEAMLNGLPVVATDLEPLHDLLGHEDAGLLFPLGDAAAASGAIRRLALAPDLRVRLGEEGRRRAAAFEPGAVANRMLAIYGVG